MFPCKVTNLVLVKITETVYFSPLSKESQKEKSTLQISRQFKIFRQFKISGQFRTVHSARLLAMLTYMNHHQILY